MHRMEPDTTQDHADAIRAAVRAAFSDEHCGLAPADVQSIVDTEWAAQTERVMAALYVAARNA